jgi:hypothetical protein
MIDGVLQDAAISVPDCLEHGSMIVTGLQKPAKVA